MVAFMCNAHYGGAEEHGHQIVKHLTEMGENIVYATMSCPHPNAHLCPDAQELKQFESRCGYPIERMNNSVVGTGRWHSPSSIYGRVRLLWNLYRMARRTRAEYIIVDKPIFLSTLCYIVSKAIGIPLIQTVHHIEIEIRNASGLRMRMSKWLARFNMRVADMNVCVSLHTESDVINLIRPNKVKTCVIYNSVDLDSINNWRLDSKRVNNAPALLKERGLCDGGGPIILTVATLSEHKGIHKVIAAMPKILAEFPNARYIVVGDGSYRPELERAVEDVLPSPQRQAVTFLGRVSDSEKYACYDICDVFAMPSSEEGFGLVYVEASAFGKPVIGSNVMGIPEAILDSETGFLVDPADVDALTNTILRLLRDAGERERLGKNGRRYVESKLSWSVSAKKYLNVIRELTNA